MPEDLTSLAARYAAMQHEVVRRADDAALYRHIAATLKRCLPAQAVTPEMTADCLRSMQQLPDTADPMHTGEIHAFAGQYLLAVSADDPLMMRLHNPRKGCCRPIALRSGMIFVWSRWTRCTSPVCCLRGHTLPS